MYLIFAGHENGSRGRLLGIVADATEVGQVAIQLAGGLKAGEVSVVAHLVTEVRENWGSTFCVQLNEHSMFELHKK